jgi:hypothetical protein
MVRVNAVNHIHLVATLPQCVAEAMDIHRVSTKAVGRIEGAQMQETQWSAHSAICTGFDIL